MKKLLITLLFLSISVFSFADGIDDYTKLMLHCNGSDASQTFTDDSSTGHTVTPAGTAQLDTADPKFGSADGMFDGNSDYLTVSDHADFTWGTLFTIDFWVKWSSHTGTELLVAQYGGAGERAVIFDWRVTPVVRFIVVDHLTNAPAINYTWTPTNGVWYHFAGVKDTNAIYLYIDGTKVDTHDEGGAWDVAASSADIYIGQYQGGTSHWFHGHLDEIRISVGIARWTGASFDVPTEEYTEVSAAGSIIFTYYTKRNDDIHGYDRVTRNFCDKDAFERLGIVLEDT